MASPQPGMETELREEIAALMQQLAQAKANEDALRQQLSSISGQQGSKVTDDTVSEQRSEPVTPGTVSGTVLSHYPARSSMQSACSLFSTSRSGPSVPASNRTGAPSSSPSVSFSAPSSSPSQAREMTSLGGSLAPDLSDTIGGRAADGRHGPLVNAHQLDERPCDMPLSGQVGLHRRLQPSNRGWRHCW